MRLKRALDDTHSASNTSGTFARSCKRCLPEGGVDYGGGRLNEEIGISRKSKSKSIESRQTDCVDCVENMAREYVLRARSQSLSAGLTALEMGPAPRDVENERGREKEGRREGRRKRMRRSSNSCATVRSVGTLYAYMSVQARRTRSAKGREKRVRARRGQRGAEAAGSRPRVVYRKNLWRAGRHIFSHAARIRSQLLCGREVKFIVYYRIVNCKPRLDAPQRTFCVIMTVLSFESSQTASSYKDSHCLQYYAKPEVV